ncbi:DUF805 domain-containing protein [Eupransor demetentiae]|uniref:DUF805 family (YhaH) n=1 Tax=Eupransor demetentiae TaxID=3109584 RepID=A0ABP0ES70_9LACO|nr:DUF805 family (yhaH) [Lactobacillaceae bacterium LMG 33000]
MITAYVDFWKRYFDFKGKSSRSDFWWVFLVNTVLVIAWVAISIATKANVVFYDVTQHKAVSGVTGFALYFDYFWVGIGFIYYLASLIPNWSLSFRRYRDTNMNIWAAVILLVFPIVVGGLGYLGITNTILTIVNWLVQLVAFVVTLLPSNIMGDDDEY